MKNRWFSNFRMIQPENEKAVGDAANRIKILADLLPGLAITNEHVQTLD
jgi:hypothetical protein